jgi:hypothetical protein
MARPKPRLLRIAQERGFLARALVEVVSPASAWPPHAGSRLAHISTEAEKVAMVEVIRVIEDPVVHQDVSYRAQVVGRLRSDEKWEGWVEFVRLSGLGSPIHSPRETTQPDREALRYWASGLSEVYLEGALQRAVEAAEPRVPVDIVPAVPIFDEPASRR